MLQASKEFPKMKRKTVEQNLNDIIIYKVYYETKYDEEGRAITERIKKPVNLTKKVNETAKLLNKQTAEQKLAQMNKILQQ